MAIKIPLDLIGKLQVIIGFILLIVTISGFIYASNTYIFGGFVSYAKFNNEIWFDICRDIDCDEPSIKGMQGEGDRIRRIQLDAMAWSVYIGTLIMSAISILFILQGLAILNRK